jgi:hypothetical protein
METVVERPDVPVIAVSPSVFDDMLSGQFDFGPDDAPVYLRLLSSSHSSLRQHRMHCSCHD